MNRVVAARLPPVLLAAVVLHTAVFPDLRLFGVGADVLLLLPVAAGVTAGPDRGAAVGFVSGLLADCFLRTPFGLSALTGCLVGWSVGRFQSGVLDGGRWMPALTALVATAGGVLAFALLGAVLGQDHLLSGRLLTVTAVAALINAVLSPVVIRLVGWALAVAPAPDLQLVRR